MKILTRKQFMEMPAGTVFSYYQPCFFNGLSIKDSSPEKGYPDFSMSDLIGSVEHGNSDEFSTKCDQMELGESMPVDFEFSGREGLFDDELLYAVYEKEDVIKLINRLRDTLL
jgi:hypothetical protein